MSGELVLYDSTNEGLTVPPRRRRVDVEEPSDVPQRVSAPSLDISEEVREQLDAYLEAASERDPARAGFMDLMTASLGALLIRQELRTRQSAEQLFTF